FAITCRCLTSQLSHTIPSLQEDSTPPRSPRLERFWIATNTQTPLHSSVFPPFSRGLGAMRRHEKLHHLRLILTDATLRLDAWRCRGSYRSRRCPPRWQTS